MLDWKRSKLKIYLRLLGRNTRKDNFMKYNRVLVISDNPLLIKIFKTIVEKSVYGGVSFSYRCSFGNTDAVNNELKVLGITPVRLKDETQEIVKRYDLLFSLHCKQIFPDAVVDQVKCINVHPGYNPYNRGWYPQLFSIINKKPFGVTIHEIDSLLDHGSVIAQKKLPIYEWDTSISVYKRAIELETELLEEYLPVILDGNYSPIPMSEEGNVNYKKDYQALCQLDLTHTGTFREHIDLLRALSHGEYKNAFFITPSGQKVFVKIDLKIE